MDGGETENNDKVFENCVKNAFLSNSLLAFLVICQQRFLKKVYLLWVDLTNNAVRIPLEKWETKWNRDGTVLEKIVLVGRSQLQMRVLKVLMVLDSRTVTQTSTRVPNPDISVICNSSDFLHLARHETLSVLQWMEKSPGDYE